MSFNLQLVFEFVLRPPAAARF